MKLILRVKSTKKGNDWTEEYDSDNLTKPGYFAHRRKETVSVETWAEAEEWGKALINWFNGTCALGESTRELLGVELVPNAGGHDSS